MSQIKSVPEFPQQDFPQAKVQTKSRFSIVWLIPIVAALIGAYLAFVAISEQGPTIDIVFKSAEGLQAGKTKIKYKDVEMGQVTNIALSSDLSHVIVTAELNTGTEKYLTENTRFWVVTARVAAGEVSGLSTIFSGAYIGMDPVLEGDSTREFKGLDIPPPITTSEPGSHFLLRSPSLGSLDIGSPVYYRKFRVGQVVSYKLEEDGKSVSIKIFIQKAHVNLVRNSTRFWNAGGIDVSVGAEGVKVNTESLVSLLIGGIAFDTPTNLEANSPANIGQEFNLFENKDLAFAKAYAEKNNWLLYFDSSVKGLVPGSPVEFRGIKIGQVVDVKLNMDIEKADIQIPVLIEIERERFLSEEQIASLDENTNVTDVLVEKGMRAQLRTANLLTGQLVVEIDFFPDAPPAKINWNGRYPEFPTIPASMEEITTSLTQLLNKLEKMPFEQIGNNLNATIKNTEKLTGSEGLAQAIESLKVTLQELEQTTKQLNQNVAPAVESTLLQTQQTMKAAESLLQSKSPLQQQLSQMLKELEAAARSIRKLTDYLERHPDALLKGK